VSAIDAGPDLYDNDDRIDFGLLVDDLPALADELRPVAFHFHGIA
jgi:hypothetical protein